MTAVVQSAPARSLDRNAQLRQHQPMVTAIARRMRARLPANVGMDELVQAGLIGLDEALDRFEENRGYTFGTYACRRIEGAMLDALRSNDTLSRGTRARLREAQAAVQLLEHRLGRAPRAKEVANELGWTITELHDCLVSAGAAGARSNDETLEHEFDDVSNDAWSQTSDFTNAVADEYADPAHGLQMRQRHEALAAAFDTLDERERFVMEAVYDKEMTLAEVGAALGVTASRISRMTGEIAAKLKLRMQGH
jgi:RNA polymerase sigma factor for flagellar operon FliA